MENDFLKQNSILYIIIPWISILVLSKVLKLERYNIFIKFYQIKFKIDGSKIQKFKKITNHPFATFNITFTSIALGVGLFTMLSYITGFFTSRNITTEEISIFLPGVRLGYEIVFIYIIGFIIPTTITTISRWIVISSEKIPAKYWVLCFDIRGFTDNVEFTEKIMENPITKVKLKIISAGITSNFILFILITSVLITNPVFAFILPEPIQSIFYNSSEGVPIIHIIENSGAEKAGLMANDIITSVNGIPISGSGDFPVLNSNDIVTVSILRNDTVLQVPVEAIPAPDDPERGLIGIMRDTSSLPYEPTLNFIEWNNHYYSAFLIWLWSTTAVYSLIPFPKINNSGKFIRTVLEERLSEKQVKIFMMCVYLLSFFFFAIILYSSYIQNGWL